MLRYAQAASKLRSKLFEYVAELQRLTTLNDQRIALSSESNSQSKQLRGGLALPKGATSHLRSPSNQSTAASPSAKQQTTPAGGGMFQLTVTPPDGTAPPTQPAAVGFTIMVTNADGSSPASAANATSLTPTGVKTGSDGKPSPSSVGQQQQSKQASSPQASPSAQSADGRAPSGGQKEVSATISQAQQPYKGPKLSLAEQDVRVESSFQCPCHFHSPLLRTAELLVRSCRDSYSWYLLSWWTCAVCSLE